MNTDNTTNYFSQLIAQPVHKGGKLFLRIGIWEDDTEVAFQRHELTPEQWDEIEAGGPLGADSFGVEGWVLTPLAQMEGTATRKAH